MFVENEDLVLDDNTENTEEPTVEQTDVSDEGNTKEKEPSKLYTPEEVSAIVDKKFKRREAKLRREYDKKYGELENVLKNGTGVNDLNELASQFKDFYKNKGVDIPEYVSPETDEDLSILADADAQAIINDGFDDVVTEVDRLANKERTKRENLTFLKLAEYRKNEESKQDLKSMGVDDKDLQDKEFLEFSSHLDPEMSLKDKYNFYLKYRPKPKVENVGSMQNTNSQDNGVKNFYTKAEAEKFTRKDFDKIPGLLEAVEKSMAKWK